MQNPHVEQSANQNAFLSFSAAFCIGLFSFDVARCCRCLALNTSNLVCSATLGQLLLASLISAVSRIGSNLIDATSLSFTNALVTLFSFSLQICAGIFSTSLVPSL